MSSVTFPSELGGDGQTYTDDSNPSTGLANGGHRTRFVPALAGAVAMAQSAASSAVQLYRRNVLVNGVMEVWNAATGSTSCPAGSRTNAAECWYVQPSGAAVTRARSSTVRSGGYARFSLEVVGASSVTTVLIGQRIEAAEIPKITRQVTLQAYIYNGSGSAFQPNLLLGTPSAADDFTTVTNRLTQALQSCADATWTLVSHTVDISGYTNLANGLQVELQIPSGSCVAGDTIRVTEAQLCAGNTTSTYDVEPLAVTQERCGRFYETDIIGFSGNVTSGSSYEVRARLRWVKRAIPNVTWSSVANANFPTTSNSGAHTASMIAEYRAANGTGAGTYATTFYADARL